MAGKGKGLSIGKLTSIVEKPVNGNDDDNQIDQSGAVAANRINGGDGNDNIVGTGFADRVNAGDGDDTVMGGAGDDVLFGNDGDDTAKYEGSIFNFTWEAGKGNSLVVTDSTEAEGTDTLKHFENLQFGDYTLDLDGDNAAMILGDATLDTDEDNSGSATITAWDFDGGTPSVVSASVSGGGSVSTSSSSAGTSGMGVGTNINVSFDPGSAYQHLAVGESASETITVVVDDGQGNLSSHDIAVTVHGVNDDPTATGGSGSVTEDGTQTAGGTIDVSDVDASDTHSFSIQGGGAGVYGSLSIDSNGEWTYALNNDAANVQALNSGDTVTDSFVINVDDGNGGVATTTVDIDVNGADDGPVFPTPPDPDGITILTDVGVLGSWGATSGWQTKSFTVSEAGTYKIAFGSANWYDSILDGNLWIDDVHIGDDHFDFETGLSGWSTTGSVWTTTATSTEGAHSAQLHTGEANQAQMESFLGADVPNQTSYGSAMMTTATLDAGDVVSFDWRFDVTDYLPYDDYAFYMIEIV